MADLRDVVIISYTPVKDDAGLSGKRIGVIYGNYQAFPCTIDFSQLHDKDVPIVDPPTWKKSGKVGWVEWSHCIEHGDENDDDVFYELYIRVYKDGREPYVKFVR